MVKLIYESIGYYEQLLSREKIRLDLKRKVRKSLAIHILGGNNVEISAPLAAIAARESRVAPLLVVATARRANAAAAMLRDQSPSSTFTPLMGPKPAATFVVGESDSIGLVVAFARQSGHRPCNATLPPSFPSAASAIGQYRPSQNHRVPHACGQWRQTGHQPNYTAWQ